MENKKVVVYFAGGTMTGVFGAGVAMALEEEDFYPNIEAVYGSSAGFLNGMYFLARQTRLGSSVYWENMGKGFISYKNFAVGLSQRIRNRFVRKVALSNLKDAFSVDYAMSVMLRDKVLNVDKVINQPIPLYAKVFNMDNSKIEFHEVRNAQLMDFAKASISALPYVHKSVEINGNNYMDGAVMEITSVEYLARKYPDHAILVVVNRPLASSIKYRMKDYLESRFSWWMIGNERLLEYIDSTEKRFQAEIAKYRNNPRVAILSPARSRVRSRTTNPRYLKELWNQGFEMGKEFCRTYAPESLTKQQSQQS